jgi:hypothetical protein
VNGGSAGECCAMRPARSLVISRVARPRVIREKGRPWCAGFEASDRREPEWP